MMNKHKELQDIVDNMNLLFEEEITTYNLELKRFYAVLFEYFEDGEDIIITKEMRNNFREKFIELYGVPTTHLVKSFFDMDEIVE